MGLMSPQMLYCFLKAMKSWWRRTKKQIQLVLLFSREILFSVVHNQQSHFHCIPLLFEGIVVTFCKPFNLACISQFSSPSWLPFSCALSWDPHDYGNNVCFPLRQALVFLASTSHNTPSLLILSFVPIHIPIHNLTYFCLIKANFHN